MCLDACTQKEFHPLLKMRNYFIYSYLDSDCGRTTENWALENGRVDIN